MSDEVTRIQYQPDRRRKTTRETPAEERASFLGLLAQDGNAIVTGVATGAVTAVVVDKFKGRRGDPPAGGQSTSQDSASPKAE